MKMIKEEEMENRNLCPREMQIGQGQLKQKKSGKMAKIYDQFVCVYIYNA